MYLTMCGNSETEEKVGTLGQGDFWLVCRSGGMSHWPVEMCVTGPWRCVPLAGGGGGVC